MALSPMFLSSPPPSSSSTWAWQSELPSMVHAVEVSPRPTLFRQSIIPLLIATAYLVFLLVPWVLTCIIARNPNFILTTSSRYKYDVDRRYSANYTILTAIDALNALAVVLSLPVLSSLLARAAVVFTQRRKENQKLTVRQLVALADRGWWNVSLVFQRWTSSLLLFFGWVLLLIAFVLPIVRSTVVTYRSAVISPSLSVDEYDDIAGSSPGPGLLENVDGDSVISYIRSKLQTTSGGIETNLWPYCNDKSTASYWNTTCGYLYDPYGLDQSTLSRYWESSDGFDLNSYTTNGSALMFASTMKAGTTTGFAANGYALGIKSGAMCEQVSADEVSTQCTIAASEPIGDSGWNTSLFIPGQLRVDICLPISASTSTWKAGDTFPWQPRDVHEDMYISLQEQTKPDGYTFNSWGCGGAKPGCLGAGTGLHVHCQSNTTMAYFQLGNTSSKGVPSPFLNETSSSFVIPSGNTSLEKYNKPPQGPLMSTAQAMFGNDSWFAQIGAVLEEAPDLGTQNQTWYTLLQLLCHTLPLRNAGDYFAGETTDFCTFTSYAYMANYSPSELLAPIVRNFFSFFDQPWTARASLNTGAFFANDYLLSAALANAEGRNTTNILYRYDGIETRPVIPVVSTPALIAVSVLIGLQVLAMLLLLAYVYSTRVWTKTLDALAMVRIGAQLANFLVDANGPVQVGEGGRRLGASSMSGRKLANLWERDGLIDTKKIVIAAAAAAAAAREAAQPQAQDGRGVELGMLPPPPYYSASGREEAESDEGETEGGDGGRNSEVRPLSAGSVPLYVPRREGG